MIDNEHDEYYRIMLIERGLWMNSKGDIIHIDDMDGWYRFNVIRKYLVQCPPIGETLLNYCKDKGFTIDKERKPILCL